MISGENAKNMNAIKDEDRNLTFAEKLAVSITGGIATFHTQVIQLFMLYFYTDIMEISPAYVAGLFLITRIVTAFLAPVFGIFVDKVTTSWGKYKPWVIGTGVGKGVLGWLAFTNFNLSADENTIYVTITYVLYSVFIAIGQAPGNALTPAITKRIDDRISLGQIGFFVVMLGAAIAQIGVQPLYKVLGEGNDAKGFSWIMGAAAVISILVAVYQQLAIKERYIVQSAANVKGPSLKEMFIGVFTNKTAIIVYIYVFAINLANGIRSGASIYYFKYYFHNENLLAITGLIAMIPTAIGVVLSSKFTQWIGVKRNLVIGTVVSAVAMAGVIVLPPSAFGVAMFIVLLVVLSFFTGLATPAQGTMMPAAMDYIEWKTNMNINGFIGSVQGFLQTIATALVGAITAGMLSAVGYTGGAEQSTGTLFGLQVLMSILPAISILPSLAVIWFDLTEDKQAKIAKELAERRKNVASDVQV